MYLLSDGEVYASHEHERVIVCEPPIVLSLNGTCRCLILFVVSISLSLSLDNRLMTLKMADGWDAVHGYGTDLAPGTTADAT